MTTQTTTAIASETKSLGNLVDQINYKDEVMKGIKESNEEIATLMAQQKEANEKIKALLAADAEYQELVKEKKVISKELKQGAKAVVKNTSVKPTVFIKFLKAKKKDEAKAKDGKKVVEEVITTGNNFNFLAQAVSGK